MTGLEPGAEPSPGPREDPGIRFERARRIDSDALAQEVYFELARVERLHPGLQGMRLCQEPYGGKAFLDTAAYQGYRGAMGE